MSTIREQISEIIKELKLMQNSPGSFPSSGGETFKFPQMLPTGSSGSIIVSDSIISLITSIGQVIKSEENLNSRFGEKDWDRALRIAFGEALKQINDSPTDNTEYVLKSVRAILRQWDENTRETYEHVFGCTLFSKDYIKPFNIGPVRFERRSDWLMRKNDAEVISPITYRRINRVWEGKKLKSRKSSRDSDEERDIIEAIKQCPFVCSVLTEGLAQYISQEKALMAARISMVSIALIWSQPSQALEGFNLLFDGPIHSQTSLIFVSGSQQFSGYKISHHPHGPFLQEGEWENVLLEYENTFNVIGEVLDSYLKPLKQSTRPVMINTLFHALLWFHEGCRERVTMLSIVKFASSLDALACGNKGPGILRLIEARLGIEQDEKLFPDGTTLDRAVREIYESARSRTLHGTNTKIWEDWSRIRSRAELFARLCLLACIDWASKNPNCNDPNLLSRR